MATKLNPNYYAIIPATVRYDSELSASAKLLYGEIAALCNQEGFCWASNGYFAKLYAVTGRSISDMISQLEARGHVKVDRDSANGNTRNIYIVNPMEENFHTYRKKVLDPMEENFHHNNKSNNTDNSISTKNDSDSQIHAVYHLYLKQFKLKKDSDLPQTELLLQAEKRYKLTPSRRAAIVRRLADAGYKMLCAAIVGYSREPWYQGENNRNWTADLEKFICRSYEKVEEGANKYEQQKQTKHTNDPWANL